MILPSRALGRAAAFAAVLSLLAPGPALASALARTSGRAVPARAAVAAAHPGVALSARPASPLLLGLPAPALALPRFPSARTESGAPRGVSAGLSAAAAAPSARVLPAAAVPGISPVAVPSLALSRPEPGAFSGGEPNALAPRHRPLVRRHFAALRAEFKVKTGSVWTPSSAPLAQGPRMAGSGALLRAEFHGSDRDSGKDAPPAPGRSIAGRARGFLGGIWGLGRAQTLFIAALVFVQIASEALGAAMPALTKKVFGSTAAMADLAMVNLGVEALGRLLSPVLIRRFGVKAVYAVPYVLRWATTFGMIAVMAAGSMTFPLMAGMYAASGLLSGLMHTAKQSIPRSLSGRDENALNNFWSRAQVVLEIVGFLGPVVTGALIAAQGFYAALYALLPLSVALSGLLTLGVRVPKDAAGAQAFKKAEPGKREPGDRWVVWKTPALRAAFLAYSLFLILQPLLYYVLASGYGYAVVGEARDELAAGVGSWLTGLYSLGGLFGGLVLMRFGAKVKAEKDPAARKGMQRKSMLRWMLLGSLSFAAFATMALPLPLLGQILPVPSWLSLLSLPALALVPFGIAQVVAVLKLRSFIQTEVPDKDMASATGFIEAASLAINVLGLVLMRFLFSATGGFLPFVYLAAALVPTALACLALKGRLKRETEAKESK